MAHGNNGSEQRKLSVSWPFTFAGLCLTIALAWFCLGFAIRDRKPHEEGAEVSGPIELAGHYTVFWILLLIGFVSVVAGAIYNMNRARQRLNA